MLDAWHSRGNVRLVRARKTMKGEDLRAVGRSATDHHGIGNDSRLGFGHCHGTWNPQYSSSVDVFEPQRPDRCCLELVVSSDRRAVCRNRAYHALLNPFARTICLHIADAYALCRSDGAVTGSR